MKITVSRPINGICFNGNEYLFGEDNMPLSFNTIKGMLIFLAAHNFSLGEILELDFNIEEALGD